MTEVEPVRLERAIERDRMSIDPPIDTLVGLLANRAMSSPDREFFRFEEGTWTFGEIEDWTSRLAHRLLVEVGMRAGDRVAIMLPNVVQWPVAWLAILKAGGVAVPVNSSYQRSDLDFVLSDSGTRVIVTDDAHTALVEEVRAATVDLADVQIVQVGSRDDNAKYPADRPQVAISGDTLANLQYTSGTTGFPKACMLTHDYWVRLGWICAGAAGLGADDVVLTSQPFSYMDPQWNTALSLTIGAPLVVLPRFSASKFMADVRRHRATFCYVLGSMPTLLFKQPSSPLDRDNDLRLVLCSAIPAALHGQLEKRWGAPWREIFGMTESGADLVSLPESTADVGSGRLGEPVPTKQIRVVDPQGRDVVEGELITSGKPMMLGYWNRPDDTAQVLRDGWLHTGDVAVRDGDSYRLVGRIKDMVRRGGENIASAEVERVLERDDTVVAAAVVGVPDELFGEEVKAFVQLAPGVETNHATAERIIDAARNQLARFKIPRYVEFVDDFPRTPSERVSKPALKARSAEHPGTTYDLQPPRTGDYLDVGIDDDVAILTLNRPTKLNAMDVATRVLLAQTIRRFGAGDRVRGIVLTGNGRAFSAGEDLQKVPTTYDEIRTAFATFHDITRAILETKVPVIAAVNGIAVGGASEITLCCDARIGTPHSEYFQPENHRGIIISNASSLLMGRLVRNHAMRIVLGSPRIGADEALRIGLLDEIVAPDALVDRAIEVVRQWNSDPRTTALHLGLLRPRPEEIEAAFTREDDAARQSWETGAFTAGIEGFWASKTATATRN